MSAPILSIVIPAKNEQGSVEILYLELLEVLKTLDKSYEIIFVDDGSTDNTFNILKELQRKDRNIKVVKLRGNFGKSIALQAGFNLSKAETVITMDADLQDNPHEIPNFLKKLNEGYDMVSGWKRKRNDPLSKVV